MEEGGGENDEEKSNGEHLEPRSAVKSTGLKDRRRTKERAMMVFNPAAMAEAWLERWWRSYRFRAGAQGSEAIQELLSRVKLRLRRVRGEY